MRKFSVLIKFLDSINKYCILYLSKLKPFRTSISAPSTSNEKKFINLGEFVESKRLLIDTVFTLYDFSFFENFSRIIFAFLWCS